MKMVELKDFKQFDSDMSASQELVDQYNQILKRIVTEKSAESDADAVVKAAEELGYSVSASELERLMAQKEEMDADELESVTGGEDLCLKDYACMVTFETDTKDSDGYDYLCVASWHCNTAFMHTTPGDGYEGEGKWNNRQCACWSDYACMIVNRHPCSIGATEG